MEHLGQRTWVIAEGCIPLDTGDADAHVEITFFFPDRRQPANALPSTIAYCAE